MYWRDHTLGKTQGVLAEASCSLYVANIALGFITSNKIVDCNFYVPGIFLHLPTLVTQPQESQLLVVSRKPHISWKPGFPQFRGSHL